MEVHSKFRMNGMHFQSGIEVHSRVEFQNGSGNSEWKCRKFRMEIQNGIQNGSAFQSGIFTWNGLIAR